MNLQPHCYGSWINLVTVAGILVSINCCLWPRERVLINVKTATDAEIAESHIVTVAQHRQHGQCYWEYNYIWEH